MQPQLPLISNGLLYECANPECFHVGSLLRIHECGWQEYWDSEAEDLLLRSVCPSCQQPMMIWSDEDEKHETTKPLPS